MRHRAGLALAALAGLAWGTSAAPARADAAPAQAAPTPAQAAPAAAATAPSAQQVQSLIDKMNAMQAKIDQLEAKEKDQDQRRAGQASQQAELQKAAVDASVAAVQRDAAAHSQLFDMQGFTAGYSNGKFVIRSEDGSFSWHPWLHLQFRNIVNYRQSALANHEDDTEDGFEVRRARFGFDGNLFSPDFNYFINWATYRANSSQAVKVGTASASVTNVIGGLPVLEEAWVKYKLPSSDFYLKAGQMHDPLAHEEIVGSKYEVTAERSVQNDIFSNTDAFTQAVTLIYDPKKELRFETGLNQGIRGANTSFQDYPNNGNAYNWGYAGRVEYKVMGNWKDYDQLTAYGDSADLLVFGAGADYSEAGKDAQLTHTVDAQYGSTTGLFLYGAYEGRYTRHNIGIPNGGPVATSYGTPAVSGEDTYEPSMLLQASYAIDTHFEPFVRYEYMHLQGTPTGSDNNVHEVTGGLNYWFHGHNAKLVTQVMFLPNGIPISDTSSDVLASNGHAEIVVTTQFQLLL